MGDWWLLAWAGAGLLSAYGFSGAALVHARRNGRRWHEVALAFQVFGIVVCCTYVLASMLVGPWWALVMAPGFMVIVYTLIHLLDLYLERRAVRAVLAREAGK